MNTKTNLSIVAFGLLATTSSTFATDWEDLEVSASVAATSNYVWRGNTQSESRPAIQGAFDFDYTLFETDGFLKDAGVFLGVWASSIDKTVAGGKNSLEVDIYGGLSGTLDVGMDIGWNAGWLRYQYPGAATSTGSNFDEVFAGIDIAPWDVLSLDFTAYFGVEVDNTINWGNYYDANIGFSPLAGLADDDPASFLKSFTISGHFGHYDRTKDGTGDNYVDWKIGVAQDILGVTTEIAYWDTDLHNDEGENQRPIYMVTFSKSF